MEDFESCINNIAEESEFSTRLVSVRLSLTVKWFTNIIFTYANFIWRFFFMISVENMQPQKLELSIGYKL